MRHILKQVVTVFNIGLGGEKRMVKRLTAYFWQLEPLPQDMHAFPHGHKASIWDWARTPTGLPMHTGQDLTYMHSNVPGTAVSHAEMKLWAGSFTLPLFRQSGFSAIHLFHSLDMLSKWDALLLPFTIEWLHPHEHIEQSSSSHTSPHTAGLFLCTRL